MSAKVRHAGPEPKIEAPSAAIVRKANEIVTVTDARGRRIGFKKLNALERARFFKVIGAEAARNEIYLSIAVPAQMSVSIDGNTLGHPMGERDLDARIAMLDDDGLEAINNGIVEHFGPEEEAAEDEAKN